MSAATTKFVAYACGHRFAIYQKRKDDGAEWFAIHDAETVTDADVRAGISPKKVRHEATLEKAQQWCARQI